MIDTKIQWHPGFIAAIDPELKDYREDLIFEKEYNLNTKPLEIDLLIIKKEATVHIANDIGSFFKGHNILERVLKMLFVRCASHLVGDLCQMKGA